jgi:hypothetical protein
VTKESIVLSYAPLVQKSSVLHDHIELSSVTVTEGVNVPSTYRNAPLSEAVKP